MKKVSWTQIKSYFNTKGLNTIQHVEDNKTYTIWAVEGETIFLQHVMKKQNPQSEEEIDWEINYKSHSNSKLVQKNEDGFTVVKQGAYAEATGFRGRLKGFSGTATKNTSSNLQWVISAERWINGGCLLVKNQVWGDKVHFEVVDVNNVLGYGAGAVLDRFVEDWYIDDTVRNQGPIVVPFLARIVAGLYIRIVYISVGNSTDVDVKLNAYLNVKT